MRQPLQVLVYPVRVRGAGWEFLLLRRRRSKGGFWQGVTGGVEEVETVREAAARELFEETGFTRSALEPIGHFYVFPLRTENRKRYRGNVVEVTEIVFVAFVEGSEDPALDGREHSRWRWCSLEEGLGMLKWPDSVEALRRSDAFVKAYLMVG
jgi:8-oxo-dGTP pyrophosphatase MutT (NUDIX family)